MKKRLALSFLLGLVPLTMTSAEKSSFDMEPTKEPRGTGSEKLAPVFGECTICEMGMKFVEKEILTKKTVDMVERSVLMMCSIIPGKYADQCEKFVETHGDHIIKTIIETDLSPKMVCTELGFCDRTRDLSNLEDGMDCGKCASDIIETVKDCVEAGIEPTRILHCVVEALGAGSDCLPCACQLIKTLFPQLHC